MHHIRVRLEPREPFDIEGYVAALIELAKQLVAAESIAEQADEPGEHDEE